MIRMRNKDMREIRSKDMRVIKNKNKRDIKNKNMREIRNKDMKDMRAGDQGLGAEVGEGANGDGVKKLKRTYKIRLRFSGD